MNPLDLDNQLNALIVQGENVAAFQKFYDENVVAQENNEPERHGRDEWMRGFVELAKNIESGNARVIANAANGDVSFSEWENEFVIKGVGPVTMVQVAVRHWRNGRVIRERFYHK